VLIVLAVIAGVIILKSCGEPYSGAKETVDEFMEEIIEGEGKDAIKYLYPAYRDDLARRGRTLVCAPEPHKDQGASRYRAECTRSFRRTCCDGARGAMRERESWVLALFCL